MDEDMGISYREELTYPAEQEKLEKIEEILRGLRYLDDEFLIVELTGYPGGLVFFQTCLNKDGTYLVEAGLESGGTRPRIFRKDLLSEREAVSVFREVCLSAEAPDPLNWEEVSRRIFCPIRLDIFKTSYRVVRRNSKDIYRGFGFKHLSDATQYYVHPNNESFNGTTTLAQPIGEALILFAMLLRSIREGKGFGEYYMSKSGERVFLDFYLPDEYRENGVVEKKVFRYRALASAESVMIAAYDEKSDYIEDDMDHLHPLYKLLPAVMALAALENETNAEWSARLEDFLEAPAADTFVRLHEDLYQAHKTTEYQFAYMDLSDGNSQMDGWTSYSEKWKTISENRNEAVREAAGEILRFPEEEFSAEQLVLIPSMPAEFVLPEGLDGLCNAVAAGDVRSVLFNGPAGTGKTISCKLIAEATGLPLMETINCTENLDEFVLGKYIPEEDRILFRESYVTRAVRDGGAVVFEEINFAKPQYLAFLNSLLDDNGFVRLDTGETVRRHPNFRFFATMNMGYFGTKELNQALYNRFNAVIEVAELSEAAIRRMLTARVPECEPYAEKILGVYRKIKKKIEAEELDAVISPRNLENWARMAKYEGYIKAAEKTLIPIARCDRALESAIRGMIQVYKWK